MYKHGRTNRKGQFIKILIILVVVGLLLAVGAIAAARQYYNNNLRPVSSSQATVMVTIPDGYTLPQTSQLLKDKQLIRNKQVFEQYVRNNGAAADIKAGTYELSPSLSVQEIVAIITEGKISSNLVTIAPSARLTQIRAALHNSGYSDEEIEHALNPATYANHPALVDKPEDASLEGYLYPESFQRNSATKAEDIIKLSLDEMDKRLTPDLRAAFAGQGLSVHRAIILASIVEGEVSNLEDRKQAAQVFLRRLEIGMALQSNATDNLPPEYDTYQIPGLPPGPISNVTESALRAVAYPAGTDFLYFVSGKDCVTRFSRTVAEHDALKLQYGVATPEDNCT